MLRPYRIGRVFGIPLEVNVSFLFLLAMVFFTMGGAAGLFVTLAVFTSVVLHELGHALLARHLGVPVTGIELSFFGGAAKLAGQPRSARDEVAIAAAGPAVSFALAGIAHLGAALSGIHLLELLASVNLVIGLFNLIPALPMDGGRILRALLSGRLGFLRATEVAVKIARVLSAGFVVAGLALGQLTVAVIGVVVWVMGSAELRMARVRGYARPEPPPVRIWVVRPGA